jgi:hypothetical protein
MNHRMAEKLNRVRIMIMSGKKMIRVKDVISGNGLVKYESDGKSCVNDSLVVDEMNVASDVAWLSTL